ncbi:MAG: SDR family oxidoreductase [Nanoarchaeota archaeon]
MNIKGKIVIITGGSSGIGESIAKLFINNGARVIVFGLHKPNYKSEFYKVDISNEEEIKEALEKIPKIDILINNAGIAKILSIEETTTEIFDEIFNINFKGVFWMCRYSLPKLKEGSCIINVSSIAGIKSFANYGAYCASKSAVISFTKTLALELSSKKIRANAIAPGIIDTTIFSKMMPSEKERKSQLKEWMEEVPLKRFGKPDEIAHAVLFLVENDFTNGVVLTVDGGESTV